MPDVTSDDHTLAARLATEAGRLLVDLRTGMTAEAEAEGRAVDGKALGREGDRQAHVLLMAGLTEARPDDAVLSEEGVADPARLSAARVWIVDPLDGTREYSELPRTDWAVHVALVVDGEAIAGAVALPARDLTLASEPAPPAPPAWAARPGSSSAAAGRRSRRPASPRRWAASSSRSGLPVPRPWPWSWATPTSTSTTVGSTSGTLRHRWRWLAPPACTCPASTEHHSSTTGPTPTFPTC